MYKKVLVEREIRDGARMLEELDRRGFGVTGCFWYDVPDSPSWKLVIAAKIVDREGPLGAYGLLNNATDDLGLPFEFDVSLWSPNSAHFKAIVEKVGARNLVETEYR